MDKISPVFCSSHSDVSTKHLKMAPIYEFLYSVTVKCHKTVFTQGHYIRGDLNDLNICSQDTDTVVHICLRINHAIHSCKIRVVSFSDSGRNPNSGPHLVWEAFLVEPSP